MAVDEQFELADMKSSNGFCPKLPWLRIPSWGAMKFLQGARLMQIMRRSCYQGTLRSAKGDFIHSKKFYVNIPEQKDLYGILTGFSS